MRRAPRVTGTALAIVLAAACQSPGPSLDPVPVAVSEPSPSTRATARPTRPAATGTARPTTSPDPTPRTAIAPLDGLPVDPTLATRLPLAIMIDDNVQARPQFGFNRASIVYQAPADGGEDRYMFVFQEQDAERVEPVRSGRPYFVRWAAEYRAAFGHYGGDAKTLAYIPTVDGRLIYDVDALFGSAAAYRRDPDRVKPHNAYTTTDRFRKIAERGGAPTAMVDGLPVRPFADDLAAAERPAEGWINVPYKRGAATYTYDPATNAYLRSVAGKPHKDALDGQRVTARNVVVLFMRESVDPESEPGYRRPVLDQIGTGKAIVFRDGLAFEGTWSKANAGDLTRFFDEDGNEITLVRGRIFIQVVATGTDVTYRAE